MSISRRSQSAKLSRAPFDFLAAARVDARFGALDAVRGMERMRPRATAAFEARTVGIVDADDDSIRVDVTSRLAGGARGRDACGRRRMSFYSLGGMNPWAVKPPSMGMMTPVTYELAGMQRKATTDPTSRGSPTRPMGVRLTTASR